MFRRPNARKDSIAKLQRAIPRSLGWMRDRLSISAGVNQSGSDQGWSSGSSYGMESLEPRRLMHTFNSLGQQGTYDFWTGTQVEEISFNDVVFEAVGIFVDPTTGAPKLGMTPGDPTTTPPTPPMDLPQASNPEPSQGENLYFIFVTESNPDSFISVYVIDPTTGTPEPFTGTAPSLLVTNAQTGQPYLTTPAANSGGVLIGDVDPIAPETGLPYTALPLNGGFGLVPDPGPSGLNPGITVIPINATTGAPNNFGNFLVGGTVLGDVSFGGNLNEFYAGSVLTGDVGGDPAAPQAAPTDVRTDPNNFQVAGDLREFITNGPVGTDGVGGAAAPQYVTSFDLNVGGKIGEIHIGNSEAGTNGMFAGTIEAGNSPLISGQTAYTTASPANLTGIFTPTLEAENLALPDPDAVFTNGNIDLRNDTAADAQVLSSVPELNALTGLPEKDANGNIIYEAEVEGNLDVNNGDVTDFYAVPLLAGTTFQFTLSANTAEVFDPDGRLVATNSQSGTGPQQYTADRPGLYLFAVTGNGGQYALTVSNVGNMAIGGIVTTGDFTDIGVNSAVIAANGDLGAIDIGGTYLSTTTGPTPAPADANASPNTSVPVTASTSILVDTGDLRALIGGAIGEVSPANANILIEGPTLSVPNGSVGLIEADNGVLNFNSQFDPNYQNLATPQFVTDDAYASAIGGSIQRILGVDTFQGNVAVNAGIGSIVAGNMATDTPSYIDVNADNKGEDGIIDLINVAGDFGDQAGGGPEFVTHNGGDIRYMLLSGANIFRDSFFGGGLENGVRYPAGQAVTYTDQAGNVITITPTGPITTTTTTVTTTPATTTTNSSTGATTNTSTGQTITTSHTNTSGAAITFGGYQIRDKGGVVPIEIVSSGSMIITAKGTGPNADVTIPFVQIQGTGPAVSNLGVDSFGNTTVQMASPVFTAATNDGSTTATVTNADGSTTTTTTTISGGGTTTNLSLQLMGSAKIDVLDAQVVNAAGTALSNANLIENDTLGELASVNAANVGQLITHGNLGFTKPVATPAADIPLANTLAPDLAAYPFVNQTVGVDITGDAIAIQSYGAIGNVDVAGTLMSLTANYGASSGNRAAKPIAGQFNGLVGPIAGGNLLAIDIGQGVLPTGTGAVGFAGIFATNEIGLIDNRGNSGADIRGNIESEDSTFLVGGVYQPGIAIGQINLKNGSIIDAQIDVIDTTLNQTFANTEFGGAVTPADPFTNQPPFASPFIYELGSIVVTGKGGIIGATINVTDVGPIIVNGGAFGVLDTTINSLNLGRVYGITASGYGIRNSTVSGGGYLGPVVTTGNGSLLSVLNFPIDVRESDIVGQLDPYFGFTPAASTDLNAELGTSLQTPNIAGVTDTGVVQDDVFKGQESFAGLTTFKVRTAEPLYTAGVTLPTPTVPNVPVIGVEYPMEINFGTSVGQIHVYEQVDGLQITTGTLKGFYSGVSVNRLGISTAGELDALQVHGNLGNFIEDRATGTLIPDSYINAGGPSGILGNIKVLGNLSANISATGVVENVTITGDLLGSLTAEGQTNGEALQTLHVFGGIRDNSLTLDGNVGSIIVNGTLGTSAGSLVIAGSANLISVGANAREKGSTLGLALTVEGTLKTLSVHGTITGPVVTGADLDNLVVNGDGTAANVISNTITVDGRLYKATISKGNVASNITANGFIQSFTISHGSLLAGVILQSVLDSINSFKITGGLAYGMFGSLLATNGTNVNINVSGSIGDGTDPATITANSGTTFKVTGNIADHATIAVAGQLNLLQVTGDIQSGAVISAHPLVTQKITGTNDGSITIV